MRRFSCWALVSLLVIVVVGVCLFFHYGRSIWHPKYLDLTGRRTVADVLGQYGKEAMDRLTPAFENAGVSYPPARVALLGMKAERSLELWACAARDWHFIKSYPIKSASGTAGPKLREGDRQVPEGVYRITFLNPNSSYHLSMMLDYPNAFDLRHAKKEGRSQPGSDIFIHGKSISVGCLAMGDSAIEELFVLVATVGMGNAKVVIAPHDPRTAPLPRTLPNGPTWLPALYASIQHEFRAFEKTRTDHAEAMHTDDRESALSGQK